MELYKTDKSPYTVVLCTFYGAAHRVRQKYADMWVKKGLSVITVSVGVPDANSRAIERESNSDLLGRAKAALDTLIANGLDKQLLIFHVISEGGTSSWLRLIQLMESKSTYAHMKSKIVGYVLDSCPYHFGYLSTYKAIFSGYPFFKRMGLMFLFTVQVFLKRVLALIPFLTRFWPSLTFSSLRAYRETVYARHIGTLAQLYVWTTKDAICSPNYIADYVSRRQSVLGTGAIDTLVVNDAPHVHILRLHAAEYNQKIDAFLSRLPNPENYARAKI